jgi:hypothetical protein
MRAALRGMRGTSAATHHTNASTTSDNNVSTTNASSVSASKSSSKSSSRVHESSGGVGLGVFWGAVVGLLATARSGPGRSTKVRAKGHLPP